MQSPAKMLCKTRVDSRCFRGPLLGWTRRIAILDCNEWGRSCGGQRGMEQVVGGLGDRCEPGRAQDVALRESAVTRVTLQGPVGTSRRFVVILYKGVVMAWPNSQATWLVIV